MLLFVAIYQKQLILEFFASVLTTLLLHCFNGQLFAAVSLAAPVQVGHDGGPLMQVVPRINVKFEAQELLYLLFYVTDYNKRP
jgi:hypothetical protein